MEVTMQNTLISESILLPITQDQRRRLLRIDSEDFSSVLKKTMEDLSLAGQKVSLDYAERGIYALKQYYAVAMLDPANAHAVTVSIDPFWHSHILFTANYRHFCDEAVGEYMDHVPLDKNDTDKVTNVAQLYNYTLEVISKLFSRFDRDFWSPAITSADLICYHKGNREIYIDLQKDRLFEPVPRGQSWAYAE